MPTATRTIHMGVGWKNLFDSRVPFAEIVSAFSGLDATSMVTRLAWLSFRIRMDGAQEDAEANLFDHDLRQRLSAFRKLKANHGQRFAIVAFSRAQILAAIKLAFLACSRQGGVELTEQDAMLRLGRALLQLNDYLQIEDRENWPEILDLIDLRSPVLKSMLSTFLLENGHDFLDYFSRFDTILFRYLPKHLVNGRISQQSLESAFFRCHNCEAKDAMLLALSVQFKALSAEGNTLPGVREAEFFQNCIWSEDRLARTLSYLVRNFGESDQDLLRFQSTAFPFDHTAFRSKPLCRIGSDLVVLDREFLTEAIGHQLYFAMRDSLGRDRRQELDKALGLSFEDYIREILTGPTTSAGCEFKTPSGSGKIADFIIDGDGATIVIEATAAMLDQDDRYAIDSEGFSILIGRLKKELPQLVRSIQDEHAVAKTPRRHFALLIGLDRSLSFWKIQSTLEPLYRAELAKIFGDHPANDRVTFPRLIIFSVEDAESYAKIIQNGVRPRDCLEAIVAEDAAGTGCARDVMFQRGFPMEGNLPVGEKCCEALIELVRETFPESPSERPAN